METAQAIDGPAAGTTRPPRWAVVAAYAVPLCLLPSAVWRAQLVMTTELANGWFLLVLSGAELSLGLLTLGLVRPWGEALPRWVPLLGGRRIPTRVAVIPATVGAIAVTLLSITMVINRFFPRWGGKPETIEEARALSSFDIPANADLGGVEAWVAWLYAPSLAWGPLLAAVTLAYYRRRRHSGECLSR